MPTPDAPSAPLRTVYVIRHAEKPGRKLKGWDGAEEDDNSLTIAGWARAGALALLFGRNLGGRFMRPGALVASKGKTKSNRPLQTLGPLALLLGLTVDARRDAEKDLLGMIVAIKQSQWLVTLACLEHSMIVKFLKAWGIADIPWDHYPDRYDLVLVLSERADRSWSLRVDLMEAMAGDQVVA